MESPPASLHASLLSKEFQPVTTIERARRLLEAADRPCHRGGISSMAGTPTLSHEKLPPKSPINKSRVLTIYWFGVPLRVQSGHLSIEYSIGPERPQIRL